MSEKMNDVEIDEIKIQKPLSLEKELEMDTEEPESVYPGDMRSMQRESDFQRLSSRVTFLFILIPTLLCAVFAFAYFDLRGRLKETISSGEKEVQALSQDVVGRVTTLLDQYKELEKAMADKLTGIEKRLETVTAGLDREENAIKDLASTKVDANEVAKMIQKATEDLTANVAALKDGLTAQKASVETLAGKVEKELKEGANAVTTFQSDLRIQEEQVTKISETLEQVQTKSLALDLNVRRLLDDRETLNKELENLKNSNTALQQKIEAIAVEPKKKTQGATTVPPPAPGAGQILEQDIAR